MLRGGIPCQQFVPLLVRRNRVGHDGGIRLRHAGAEKGEVVTHHPLRRAGFDDRGLVDEAHTDAGGIVQDVRLEVEPRPLGRGGHGRQAQPAQDRRLNEHVLRGKRHLEERLTGSAVTRQRVLEHVQRQVLVLVRSERGVANLTHQIPERRLRREGDP